MEEAPLANPPAEAEDEKGYPTSEEGTEGDEEAAPVEATPAPKKRGRPAVSKNREPDAHTALLERMTQLERTLSRPPPPPESSAGGIPETPPPAPKAKR